MSTPKQLQDKIFVLRQIINNIMLEYNISPYKFHQYRQYGVEIQFAVKDLQELKQQKRKEEKAIEDLVETHNKLLRQNKKLKEENFYLKQEKSFYEQEIKSLLMDKVKREYYFLTKKIEHLKNYWNETLASLKQLLDKKSKTEKQIIFYECKVKSLKREHQREEIQYVKEERKQNCKDTIEALQKHIYKLNTALNYCILQLGIDLKNDRNVLSFVNGCINNSKRYKPTKETCKKLTPEAYEFLQTLFDDDVLFQEFIQEIFKKVNTEDQEKLMIEQIIKEVGLKIDDIPSVCWKKK